MITMFFFLLTQLMPASPKHQLGVVFDGKRPRVLLVRIDVSGFAVQSEITLTSDSQNDIENHNRNSRSPSNEDPGFDRINWTPDKDADFVIGENASLAQFALFIRNEQIDGSLIPFITYESIRDGVESSVGDAIRFLKIVEKLKNVMNFTENHYYSSFL